MTTPSVPPQTNVDGGVTSKRPRIEDAALPTPVPKGELIAAIEELRASYKRYVEALALGDTRSIHTSFSDIDAQVRRVQDDLRSYIPVWTRVELIQILATEVAEKQRALDTIRKSLDVARQLI